MPGALAPKGPPQTAVLRGIKCDPVGSEDHVVVVPSLCRSQCFLSLYEEALVLLENISCDGGRSDAQDRVFGRHTAGHALNVLGRSCPRREEALAY